MAFIELNYHSDALSRGVNVYVILPESRKTMIGMQGSEAEEYKTLYLLHGLSDDHTIWMRRTSIERYATERGIAVVMPNGGRSWYTDMQNGAKYLTFITEELPGVCRSYFRGMSGKREDNFIAGLSMGGYGAIKAALLHPEKYGAAASLSAAINVSTLERWDIVELRAIFGYDLVTTKTLAGTDHDTFALAEKRAAEGVALPRLYGWCGTEDYLIEENRAFHRHLESLGVEHIYEESEGTHGWKWWDEHIGRAIDVMLSEK